MRNRFRIRTLDPGVIYRTRTTAMPTIETRIAPDGAIYLSRQSPPQGRATSFRQLCPEDRRHQMGAGHGIRNPRGPLLQGSAAKLTRSPTLSSATCARCYLASRAVPPVSSAPARVVASGAWPPFLADVTAERHLGRPRKIDAPPGRGSGPGVCHRQPLYGGTFASAECRRT